MPFEHDALLYEGIDGFVADAVPFLRDGLAAGEPAMVAVGAERIGVLSDALGDDAEHVRFVDMAEVGRNPGRIIPAWRDFLAEHEGHGVRGIGEPIWPDRSEEELLECQLHEALLNVAFAGADGFRLLCPYDRAALDDRVLHEACGSHPAVLEHGDRQPSAAYRPTDELLAPFEAPLPPPRGPVEVLAYDRASIEEVRTVVRRRAAAVGLGGTRGDDLVLAANEAATNSIRHGGGNGVLRIWEQGGALVCELSDRGRITDPLVGRSRPPIVRAGGWGLYIAHQVCDLVQLRSDERGTVVRLHMSVPATA